MNKPDVCPIKIIDCLGCGFRKGDECVRPNKDDAIYQERSRVAEEELFASYSKLIGCKVTEVLRYSPYDDTDILYAIVFDDGRILTAIDGEYGDNALRFTTREGLKIKEEKDG